MFQAATAGLRSGICEEGHEVSGTNRSARGVAFWRASDRGGKWQRRGLCGGAIA